jgi:hypothetical protein
MKRIVQHSILVCLLFSYIVVGVLGNIEVFNLFGLGTQLLQITKTKAGLPSSGKAYWTQYKHIPSTIKVEVPSPAIFTESATHHILTYGVLSSNESTTIHLNPVISLHSSRAPPLA